MPSLDGCETAPEIRRREGRQSLELQVDKATVDLLIHDGSPRAPGSKLSSRKRAEKAREAQRSTD